MHTSITLAHLDAIASSLDPAAREMAHAHCDATAESFAVEYVRATAAICGAFSASECAEDEEWAPQGFLPADHDFITDGAAAVGVTLTDDDWRDLGRLYRDPPASAYALIREGWSIDP